MKLRAALSPLLMTLVVFNTLLFLSLPAAAQTFTNGVQTYATLSGATVTMSNRCELRVTSAATPLTGCTINLNSADAWLFLTSIKPSVVVSTYLSQVFVNGAAAVADSNVRVVQYGAGAVVIPQPPAFQPLQAFSGPHFTGVSAKYSQYVYYTGTGLGVMDQNISSFKLKRGYMAVMAQNTAGNGFSKCYIAQDGDLEIGVLPAALENHIRFIYVTPWRWTSKKGFGETGTSVVAGQNLDLDWNYSWDINQNSTRDREYVGIRQTRWWPSLSQNWQSRGVNTVLGYNEPDNTATPANLIAVGDAIWSWPDLLGTGLRVGSPSVTDGDRSSWLYPFISQADAAGLRVDFVAVHYYWCYDPANPAGATTQMYNFLKATYDQVKRPLWITEFNNGANWTTCGDPTYAQQQAAVAQMIAMLESTPFVERYAIYNWVEDVRRVAWDDGYGSLTDAGVSYRDQASSLSYLQALPDNGTRSLAEYLFETNTLDSSGYGNNALAASAPAYAAGHKGQAVVLDGTNNYIQLPPNLGNATNFTFAAWVNWGGGVNWQRIFDFGDDTSHYLFLTPNSGGNLRFAINNGSGEQQLNAPTLAAGTWVHVAVTLSGSNAKLYTNGVLAASSSSFSISPASFAPMFNYLGKSQYSTDPLFHGSLDEVQVADYALTAAQVASLLTNSPPSFSTNLIIRPNAAESVAYSTNITGTATDPDSGDTITYSKIAGPAWLSVSAGGTLTGTPGPADGGTNFFTVRATDNAGASAFSVVAVYVSVITANGVWITDGDGLWSAYANWSGSAVANGIGYTADFSTLNLTASRTVTLDSKRSIGTLKFGDTAGTQNWTLTSGGGTTLTLDTGSVTSPAIVVNQNTVTNLVSLAGTNGFTKSGAGMLILDVDNSLSGTVNVDTSNTGSGEGAVSVASPNALASASLIQIRDNNNGYSTLQLDGSRGNVVVPANINLNARLGTVPAIQNLTGTNTLAGAITVNSGGGNYYFQSDGGLLNLNGNLTAAAAGTRTFTFLGNGTVSVGGVIQNGAATNNFYKTGSGNLTLAGANTFTGTNRINAGSVTLAHSAALLTSTLDMNAADAGTLTFSTLTNATLGGLMGSRGIALTNVAGTTLALSVGANGLAQSYSGSFTGTGNLVMAGTNTFTLAAASSFTGTARISAGTLTLANVLALQGSTVDLNAADTGAMNFGALISATFGGLSGSRNLALTNASAAAVTLTVGANGQNNAYAGVLSGAGSVIKNGVGQLTLSGSNTYAGSTTVSGGTLKLSRDPVVKLTFDSVSASGNGGIVTNTGTGGAAMNGVIVGAGASVAAGGKFGNALSINGTGGKAATNIVLIPNRGANTDASGNWTVAFWLKTTTAGAMTMYQGDGTWSSSGQTTFLLNANSGTTAGTHAGAVRWAGGFLTGTAALNDGINWHFITLVDTAGTETIYVDGNLDAATSTMGLPLASGANQIWIGGSPDTDTGAVKMNGMIDEVSMFSRPLSVAEIRSLTNSQPAVTVGNFGGQLPPGTALAVGSAGTFDLGGNSQTVASLADYSGGGGVITNSGAAPTALVLAGNSGAFTFSGVIADAAASNAVSVVKSGSSTMTLAGANTYRGTTTVLAGTLLVNGTSGSGAMTVSGGTLGGSGTIGGSLAMNSGTTLAPGNNSIHTLSVAGNVALNAGSTNIFELNRDAATNDQLRVTGTLALGGTLAVTNLSGTLVAGDSFPLFSSAGTTGVFTATNLPPLNTNAPALAWNFNPTNGVLSVIQLIATNPVSLVFSNSGTSLTLNWPADHTGWRLQAQTNALGAGLGTNWTTVDSSTNVSQLTLPVVPTNDSVFYRLVFP